MLSLIIKGDRWTASDAATSRGIGHTLVCEVDHGRQSVILSKDENLERIIAWYCEPSKSELGKGFPPGTLLHYGKKY